jgi:uncharacterized protein YdeI (YjbR/CyaY-like superfamily)
MKRAAKARFFASPAEFRAWFERNHESARELLVGFRKRKTGKPSITWPESVDQALCFGWIDGIRRRVDEESYTIRFTPRRPGSTWSAINIARVKELTAAGLMHTKGLEAFARRSDAKSARYAYEQTEQPKLEAAHDKRFKANTKAWAFFSAQAPSYQRVCIHWVSSAKAEETKRRRLEKLIETSAKGRRLV